MSTINLHFFFVCFGLIASKHCVLRLSILLRRRSGAGNFKVDKLRVHTHTHTYIYIIKIKRHASLPLLFRFDRVGAPGLDHPRDSLSLSLSLYIYICACCAVATSNSPNVGSIPNGSIMFLKKTSATTVSVWVASATETTMSAREPCEQR